ncbi:hypothetical protein J6590_014955 [Homalodisca vitripennis]|nr:hypothetical protein J6590_014955 [Homalodisca vitripennis]
MAQCSGYNSYRKITRSSNSRVAAAWMGPCARTDGILSLQAARLPGHWWRFGTHLYAVGPQKERVALPNFSRPPVVTAMQPAGNITRDSFKTGIHIHDICNKANRTLGSIVRITIGFTNVMTLRTLYCTLVGHVMMLQYIQDRFLCIVGTHLGYSHREPPLSTRRKQQLTQQASSGLVLGLIFQYKMLNSRIVCPELPQLVCLRTGHRTLIMELFDGRLYLRNGVMTRIQKHVNDVTGKVNFFADGSGLFERAITNPCGH